MHRCKGKRSISGVPIVRVMLMVMLMFWAVRMTMPVSMSKMALRVIVAMPAYFYERRNSDPHAECY